MLLGNSKPNQLPLVSIICLCYNHEKYVAEALHSVICQTYPNLELIVIDDASTDGSRAVIQEFTSIYPEIKFIPFSKNVGNCTAFNVGLQLSKGQYLIDFATDDLMYPKRIEKQVELLEKKGAAFGVAFSDADMIDAQGNKLKTYYKRDKQGKIVSKIPEGNVYLHLIKRQFICTPTMMIRRQVMEQIGGYDEDLVYEDYDFWVRSGSLFNYAFSDEILTAKRILPTSHGNNFYDQKAKPYLESTLKVCLKALQINKTKSENKALAVSVRYHFRLSLFTQNFEVGQQFWRLLKKMEKISLVDFFTFLLISLRVPLLRVYRRYRVIKILRHV